MSVQLEKSPQNLSLTAKIGEIAEKHSDKIKVCALIALGAIAIIAACHGLPLVPCLILGGLFLATVLLMLGVKDEKKKQEILVELEIKSVGHNNLEMESVTHRTTTKNKRVQESQHSELRQEKLDPVGLAMNYIVEANLN